MEDDTPDDGLKLEDVLNSVQYKDGSSDLSVETGKYYSTSPQDLKNFIEQYNKNNQIGKNWYSSWGILPDIFIPIISVAITIYYLRLRVKKDSAKSIAKQIDASVGDHGVQQKIEIDEMVDKALSKIVVSIEGINKNIGEVGTNQKVSEKQVEGIERRLDRIDDRIERILTTK